MRKVTREIIAAFDLRQPLRRSNTRTDGDSIWLFNNKIVERRDDGIWITVAGWSSRTTIDRLNGLLGVHITYRRGQLQLNGQDWNGAWICLSSYSQRYCEEVEPLETNEPTEEVEEFDVTSEWTRGGYSKPIFSVFHTLVQSDLARIEALLEAQSIGTKRMEADTEGVYRPNYFIIVKPNDYNKSLQIIKDENILF
jgi:hypothetical protein